MSTIKNQYQSDNSIESYAANDLLQTDRKTDRHFRKNRFFLTQGVSKRKDLMKISKVIFHIKPIPSHMTRKLIKKKSHNHHQVLTYFIFQYFSNILSKNSQNRV